MKILDGKKIAGKILENLKKEIEKKRLKLKLAVVLIGESPVSKIFIKEKQKACEFVGIGFQWFKFSSKISSTKIKKEIEKIVRNPVISGIVIQLPLPKKLNSQKILNLISSQKDVDVLSDKTRPVSILPPVVCAVSCLLKEYKITIKDKNIVLIGAGKLVGRPLASWLSKEKANIVIVDKSTKNISSLTKKADIIISGVGKPNLITGKMVKKGAVVIDAGTSSEKGKSVGDVDFKSVSKKASYITPFPGGVGPLTVACLLENLVKLNE